MGVLVPFVLLSTALHAPLLCFSFFSSPLHCSSETVWTTGGGKPTELRPHVRGRPFIQEFKQTRNMWVLVYVRACERGWTLEGAEQQRNGIARTTYAHCITHPARRRAQVSVHVDLRRRGMLSAEPCEVKIEVCADEFEEVTRQEVDDEAIIRPHANIYSVATRIRSPPREHDRSIDGPRHETADPGDFITLGQRWYLVWDWGWSWS
ncbi:hypothetical protein B0H14DRAFT_2597367 [Mycena olivaceomarginata]|nr:hypothetical protein B0H14DRAFT_2597367 [Mycena olivaceomarginata]